MKFGTSGLRGLVVELAGKAAAIYAEAFARHLIAIGAARAGSEILVGYDLRSSSPGIAATCRGALHRAGFVPIDCGAIPTPALAFYGLSNRLACLMVTGSHIPADRNGIKFYRPDGEIDKADEEAISAIAASLSNGQTDASPCGAPDRSAEAQAAFLARNRSVLPGGALQGLRIGVYQHSTVARDLFASVLEAYGADVVPLGRSDHFIPVDTEAVSLETVQLLVGWAKEHQLDAIVSADGDGDRPLIADETGSLLRGDLLGLITAQFLTANTVVTPVTSNSAIEAVVGGRVHRCRVGSPYVIATMKEALRSGDQALVGFEANGGTLTMSDFPVAAGMLTALPTRDAFLPTLAVLHLRRQREKPLSEIAAGFGLTFAAADRLENFPLERSGALMNYLNASRSNLESFLAPLGTVADVCLIDGLRASLADSSIIHLRPSGNAPEMRCYVEATTQNDAQNLLRKGLDLIVGWASRSS